MGDFCADLRNVRSLLNIKVCPDIYPDIYLK